MMMHEMKIVTIPRQTKAGGLEPKYKLPYKNKEEKILEAIRNQNNFIFLPPREFITHDYVMDFYPEVKNIIGVLIGITEDSAVIEVLNSSIFDKFKNPVLVVNVIANADMSDGFINVLGIESFMLSESDLTIVKEKEDKNGDNSESN